LDQLPQTSYLQLVKLPLEFGEPIVQEVALVQVLFEVVAQFWYTVALLKSPVTAAGAQVEVAADAAKTYWHWKVRPFASGVLLGVQDAALVKAWDTTGWQLTAV
jgi:hypothetical protein